MSRCARLALFSILSLVVVHGSVGVPGVALAEGAATIDPRTSPALLNESIVFYAGFDEGRADADLAAGLAPPVGIRGTLRFVEGRFGGGLLLGSEAGGAQVTYAAPEHVDFARAGALSFWVRPRGWKGPRARSRGYVRFVTVVAQPTTFLVQRMGFDRELKRSDRLMAGVFGSPGAPPSYIELAGTEDWGDDRWRLVVVNWDLYGFELSVDGEPFARRAAPNGLDYGALVDGAGPATFSLGNAIDEATAIDEVTLYSHPLAIGDVARLLGRTAGE